MTLTLKKRLLLAVLALGCSVHGTLLPDGSAQLDGGYEKGRPELAADGGPEPMPDAMPESPTGDVSPEVPDPACVGKADGELCGMETCAGTVATHNRCRSGACVELVEDCLYLSCSAGAGLEWYKIGRCACTSGACHCMVPFVGMPTSKMCPAGQVCMSITSVVSDGATGACGSPTDGGAG